MTVADQAAENALRRILNDLYPAANFIGEEAVAQNPKLLEALDDKGAFWIVDPLDGTRNFVQGRERFGSIVALIEDGEIRSGWIYGIPDQRMCVASCGDGVRVDGVPVTAQPSSQAPLGLRYIGVLNEPYKTTMTPVLIDRLDTRGVSCSAYAYLDLLAAKRSYGVFAQCLPWDHAAGILAVRELGGRATYLDDNTEYSPMPTYGRPLLVARTQSIWDKIATELEA